MDLFLTTHPEPYQATVAVPLGNSDHGLITISCPIHSTAEESLPPRTIWHYNNADWDQIRKFYSSFPWNDVCSSLPTPSEMSKEITEFIQLGIETFIPHTKKGAQRQNHKPWFSKACNKARAQKLKTHKELLHNPTPENRSAFLEARNVYNQTVDSAKNVFNTRIKDKVLSCPNGSKSFWSLAKNVSQNFCKSSFPPLTSNNEIVSTSIGKAELFAKQFAMNSTLNPPANFPLPSVAPTPYRMPEIIFKTSQIKKILSTLNTNKASGLDNIPAIVLKRCAPELAPI